MDLDIYKEIIRERLTPKRYEHSLNVSEEAMRLAKRYGANVEKAAIAGILHDIMKDTPVDEQLKLITKFGTILTEVQKVSSKLLHAISGALYIENVLKIEDKDILNAVKYHTTSRPNMSKLEKVVFIADFTSSERDYNGVNIMRNAANESLEKAMLEGLSFTLSDLASRKLPIDENTFFSYNEIILSNERN